MDVKLGLWTNLEKVSVFDAEGDTEVDCGSVLVGVDLGVVEIALQSW